MEKEMSNVYSHKSDGEIVSSAGSCIEKKLRLFGFELNPCNNNDNSCLKASAEGDESVNSSNTASSASDQKPSSRDHKSSSPTGDQSDDKKFECQYCFKEFANSQALGGHQNAHKKERMKKKRLQLQARKASLNSYLQPYYQNNLSFNNNHHGSTTAWFYDPSSYPSDNNQFTLSEESQINFNPCNNQDPRISKWYTSTPSQIPFQQESSTFTLTTHTDRSGEHMPAVIIKTSPLSAAASNQSCKSLDLQLSLSLQSGV